MARPAPEIREKITKSAAQLRRDCLHMTKMGGSAGGHVGPTLSCAEIVSTLYNGVLRFDPKKPDLPGRDRMLLSKGHAVQALYSALCRSGFFPESVLDTFEGIDSPLAGHPPAHGVPGIDFPTGSMGHGIPVGCGMAAAAKLKGQNYIVYVVTGDGELNEGSMWEGVMLAKKYKLDNLVIIVDHNGLQHDAETDVIMPSLDLAAKFKAFGCNTVSVDGHDVDELYDALTSVAKNGAPTAIIAKTVKGKGVPFMENVVGWHHNCLCTEDYEAAIKAIGCGEESK